MSNKSIFRFAIFSAALIISGFCNAQNLEKDSIKVNKYVKDAVKKNPIPGVYVISDAKKVAFISNYIEAKQKSQQSIKDSQDAVFNSLPGIRYKNGDQSAIPEIMAILHAGDYDQTEALFGQLERGSDQTTPVALHQEISAYTFKMLDDPDTEATAVQFLGYNKIAGYKQAFEEMLVSGRATDADRMIYWLADDGTSEIAVDYIVKQYKRQGFKADESNWAAQSFEDFIKKGSPVMKSKLLEIMDDYLQKNPFDAATVGTDEQPSDTPFKMGVIALFVKYGPQDKVVPLIRQLVDLMMAKNEEFIPKDQAALVVDVVSFRFYSAEKRMAVVNQILELPDAYGAVLDLLKDYPEFAQNPKVMDALFSGFNDSYTGTQADSRRFVEYFLMIDKATFDQFAAKNISSEALRLELTDAFAVGKMTFEQHNDYLISQGLTSKKFTSAEIETNLKEKLYGDRNSIYTALNMANIMVDFDVEASMIPLDYDHLLDEFTKSAHGKLDGIKRYVQSHYNEKDEKWEYRFLVVSGAKCFVMASEESSDWYDIEAFGNLINQLTADRKLQEQFVHVETGDQTTSYIFGLPEKVKELDKKYRLSYQIPEYEE